MCALVCKDGNDSVNKVFFYDGSERAPENVEEVIVDDKLTALPEKAFKGCISLTKVTIPESVTTIGERAFDWCRSLTAVTIPESVTSIGDMAFEGCRSLTTVTIPESVTTIGRNVFTYCSSLTTITIPESVTTIGDMAFKECRSLTAVTIPESVTSIGDHAFENCSSIIKVTIPESVTTTGRYVFNGCSSLTTITIPESVTSIGDMAFSGCSSLTTVTIPESVTTIDFRAFSGCRSLTAVTIPESVTTIGDHAFENCSSIIKVTIPESVTSICKKAFSGCSSLSIINLPSIFSKAPNDILRHFTDLNAILTISGPPFHQIYGTSDSNLQHGPGPTKNFRGKTQKGWGPEWWGVSLQQIKDLKRSIHCQNRNCLMRDFVKLVVEPATDNTGIGYALFLNQKNPLKAKVMVSHAWDESVYAFVECIESSGEEGPFWVCAFSIYQNHDESKGVTISEQLGLSPEVGPFATVLKYAGSMLAVVTSQCDIYTRLWCVFEMYIAVKNGVNVKLCPHDYKQKNICVEEVETPVKSEVARCGNPCNDPNDDEIAIRRFITSSEAGFDGIDEAVEKIRFEYLLKKMFDERESLLFNFKHKYLSYAIEKMMPRVRMKRKVETIDEFIAKHPVYERPQTSGRYLTLTTYFSKGDDAIEEWINIIKDAY